jgi:serine/threonine protein kinase/DNA-binding SARP family transcriptional activator/ABC-type glycerol-3-phosphate transport system substrate-binding protein
MRFRVLGPIEVAGESGPITLGGPKQRAVLAHLIVRANHVVPAEVLIDQVWGDEPPDAVRTSLQSYVSNLRKVLGPGRVEGRTPGYVLNLAPEELDATVFEALLREARAADGDADRVATILREALALWRGPAFADLASEPALSGEIARLDELRLQALEERLSADLDAGRHGDVIGELESLTREHPLRERLWGGLMLALYRSGRQADSLAAFQQARHVLAEELGVDPSPELQRLHERILRQDEELEIRGEPLRGYRLMEQIGEGAFGVVYRAIQPHVGREVAIKSIHPELSNQPDFVRRFEREAQLVARLEHPHVVPLYDYWREPGGAYLVMRYLRGGTLEDLVGDGGLELERTAVILDQIASALTAAHRQGVVHRDVKPGNVLLDDDDNAYLSDFGVALAEGSLDQSTGALIRGTPAYLSPEQIRLEPLTPRSDIYSLGVVLFEMLTGTHPFAEASLNALLERHMRQQLPPALRVRPELPAPVDDVIARATAKDPDARFADADQMASAFRSAIAAPAATPTRPAGVPRNPYKGLRAFLEADAADFFGRETLVRRLTERLAQPGRRSRFLCVVGPSGSGKSSVIKAGLVPALRRGAVDGSERWFIVDIVPGSNPLRELESALLGIAVTPPPSLLDELEQDEFGLARAAEVVLPDADAELLIVLDQLEEIFTLVDDDDARAHVLQSLRAAVEAPGSRVRVVATLRADFFDQPLSVRGFGDLLAERTEAITPMSPEQLERAIAGPAELVGLDVEPGLIAAMVADVSERAGALPLLQYALTELAEGEGHALTLDAYRSIGGVAGALARRAEALYQPLNETARHCCRQLFLLLVSVGEGAGDTRRRVRRSELASVADARVMDGVIETFGRHRLLSFDRDPESREPTVEIAHEALLGHWERLRDWIETSRDDLRLHSRLSSAADEWVRGGRNAEDLLTGGRLAQAEEATAGDSLALTDTERAYVDASVARRQAESEAERARHERELRLERRARSRLRGLVAVLAVAALLATSLTVVSVNRSREADRRRDESTIAGLTGAALSNLGTDPGLGLRLVLHAIALSYELDDPIPSATVEALHWTLQEAGIQYPVADADVVGVRGPLGYRGIYDVPVGRLANLALTRVGPSLPPAMCDRFFGVSSCPPLPDRFPQGLTAEPFASATEGTSALAGTTVTVGPVEDGGLARELDAWAGRTGIRVEYAQAVSASDPTDIGIGSPTLLPDLVQERRVMGLEMYLDAAHLREDYSPYLISLGSVGRDGSWPSDDGVIYGVIPEVSLKSLVWYPEEAFERAGYRVPRTWDELHSLMARMRAEGGAPWCMGLESGDADGWPATDWIEDLLLAEAGPDVYDRWTFHDINFDHPDVRRAFERFGEIVFDDRNLHLGRQGALSLDIFQAHVPMLDDPPRCWLYHYPSFFGRPAIFDDPTGSAGVRTAAFAFPGPGASEPRPVIGGGGLVVAFADRPEVRELMRFMASPDFGAEWFPSGEGAFSTNRRYDQTRYDAFWGAQAEVLHDALAADRFRFDASDLMPHPIGDQLFWEAMMRYVREGPKSLDTILAELDAAWPDG